MPVWTWSSARGLARDGHGPQYGTVDAKQALGFIAELAGPAVFVFADARTVLQTDPVLVRRIKELAAEAGKGQTFVLVAPRSALPPELEGVALAWELRPPTAEEMEALVRATAEDLAARKIPVALDDAAIRGLAEALRGLSASEAGQLLRRAALRDGRLADDDVAFVRAGKAELLEAGGPLELIDGEAGTLEAVGGMGRLKEWLRLREKAMGADAREFGLDAPRGVLLTGVPGCGKSLVAKTLARTWEMPLVLLDPARLFGPYVGETEGRLQDALRTVEAMAPCVLWVDEIEKGFAAGGEGDSGVSKRLLGSFLRWMQDRPEGVFLVATCNDVASLPAELLRKGRFDEVFFVDLPGPEEREVILRLHLTKRKREPAGFDLPRLAAACEGFSGAEIEAAIVGGLYRAYADGAELTTESLLEELANTVPLSRARAEDIEALRAWASTRTVPA